MIIYITYHHAHTLSFSVPLAEFSYSKINLGSILLGSFIFLVLIYFAFTGYDYLVLIYGVIIISSYNLDDVVVVFIGFLGCFFSTNPISFFRSSIESLSVSSHSLIIKFVLKNPCESYL